MPIVKAYAFISINQLLTTVNSKSVMPLASKLSKVLR